MAEVVARAFTVQHRVFKHHVVDFEHLPGGILFEEVRFDEVHQSAVGHVHREERYQIDRTDSSPRAAWEAWRQTGAHRIVDQIEDEHPHCRVNRGNLLDGSIRKLPDTSGHNCALPVRTPEVHQACWPERMPGRQTSNCETALLVPSNRNCRALDRGHRR